MEKNEMVHSFWNVKSIAILIIVILIITIVTLYVCNESFRDNIDKNFFKKEVTQEQATSIELTGEDNQYVYAFDKYIVTASKGKLNLYTVSGNKQKTIDITIGNPIFSSNGKYLCVAEENGQKVYMISDENIVWQNEIEGNIDKVRVNKNGYVSIIIKGTRYKTVVATYNQNGKELFKSYLSSTTAVDSDISNDNKYLAIAEINSSGSIIQSNIKVISIIKAEKDPSNSVVNNYKVEDNKLITKLNYQDKDNLVYMCDDGIHIVANNKDECLYKIKDETDYMDINLKNNIITVENIKKGLISNQVQVIIKDTQIKTESLYTLNNLVNSICTYGENIAINIGTEIHFIKNSGWLSKKYTANQEITSIVMGDSIAGIVYRDRIDIINI